MCVFCEIVKGNIPSTKIYEDKNVLAILDLDQNPKGHILVLPKKHYQNILDVDKKSLNKIMEVVQKLSKSVMKIKGVKGINIVNNCNEVAGQSVMHLHFHILPRYSKDEFIMKSKSSKKYNEKELKDLAKQIIKNID